MVSKPLLLLGLALTTVLPITSEVAARDLAETASEKNTAEARTGTNGVEESKYGGGGYGGGGGHYGGGYCHYGCCRRSYYGGGCRRCCSYAGEAVDAETEDKPHN